MTTDVAVSLVVTDLDGTLWHTDDHVPAPTRAAIDELDRRQVPFLVATGRRLASTRGPLARIGRTPSVVVLNGALGVDLVTGSRFHQGPYSADEAAAVLAAFRSAQLEPVVYVDHPDLDAFLGPTPSTHPRHVAALGPAATPDDLDRVVADEVVLAFGLVGIPYEAGAAAQAAIDGRAQAHLDRSLDHPGTASLTVAPLGQSKWDGVLAYCRLHDLDPDRVLALGDGPNDRELLDGAAVRLVPAGSHPVALERADHVIPPALDGGWAAVLDHLGPI